MRKLGKSVKFNDLQIGNVLHHKHNDLEYQVTGRDGYMVTLQGGSKADVLWYAVSRIPSGLPIPNSASFHECDKILDEFTT